MKKSEIAYIVGGLAAIGLYLFWVGLVITGVFLGVRWLWLNT